MDVGTEEDEVIIKCEWMFLMTERIDHNVVDIQTWVWSWQEFGAVSRWLLSGYFLMDVGTEEDGVERNMYECL